MHSSVIGPEAAGIHQMLCSRWQSFRNTLMKVQHQFNLKQGAFENPLFGGREAAIPLTLPCRSLSAFSRRCKPSRYISMQRAAGVRLNEIFI